MKKISLALFVGLFLLGMTACQKEPTASFTASKTTVEVGEVVMFTNTSKEGDSYEWSFGDGNTSTTASPTHTYNTAGTFIVTLKAKSKNGKKTDEATTTITVENPTPTAGFTYNGTTYPLSTGILEYFGIWGSNSGYNFDLMILSPGINFINQGTDWDATGTGHYVYFEMFTSSATDLVAGTYNFAMTGNAMTFSDYSGFATNYDIDAGTSEHSDYFASGTVTISKTGNNYTAAFTGTTETNNSPFTAAFTGPLHYFDYTGKSIEAKKRFKTRK